MGTKGYGDTGCGDTGAQGHRVMGTHGYGDTGLWGHWDMWTKNFGNTGHSTMGTCDIELCRPWAMGTQGYGHTGAHGSGDTGHMRQLHGDTSPWPTGNPPCPLTAQQGAGQRGRKSLPLSFIGSFPHPRPFPIGWQPGGSGPCRKRRRVAAPLWAVLPPGLCGSGP